MITQQDYRARRHALAKQLPPASIALIPAATELFRNGDAHYRFRQDSDFYYLTGFNEPDALLVISSDDHKSILFNRPRDKALEQWSGKRLGQEGALEELGVDAAYTLEQVNSILIEQLADKNAIFYSLGRYPSWEKQLFAAWESLKKQVRRGVKAPEMVHDLAPIIGEMRLFKSKAECSLMQKAATISVAAHIRAMQACKSLENECQLEAELLYEFTRQGCRSVAYDPIVAAGNNACTLHYTDNNQPLKKGELVLIDAGGEYQNYAADITRTYPINGCFSSEQRLIYALVLSAQKAGIACVRPGVLWPEIQQTMLAVLTRGLVDIGILQGDVHDLIAQGAYKPFYMHSSGHWLGLDVHDAGQYKIDGKWRPLEAGMVLTVEPGLYIDNDLKKIDKRFKGIGIRIEDDILVTSDGHKNLTAALPVEIDELEAIVRG